MAKSVNKLGGWAFLIGVILAVVLGFMGQTGDNWTMILLLIGLVVGILNVADHEVQPFMMSGVVLIIASGFGAGVVEQVPIASRILDSMLTIFVPATIIVALKNVFSMAKN